MSVSAMNLSPVPKGNKRLSGMIGLGAASLLISTVAMWEGKSNAPYKDKLAYNILTVCHGETRVEMRVYTDAECKDMLAEGLADFAGPVLKRNPELKGHDAQLVAAVSLAYNIGSANYNKSTVARRFSQGRWKEACDAFLLWANAGGRRVQGLVNRRKAERAICMRGLQS